MSEKPRQNCNGDYPEWGIHQDYEGGPLVHEPADICKGCAYTMSCMLRKTHKLLGGEELSDDTFHGIAKIFSNIPDYQRTDSE